MSRMFGLVDSKVQEAEYFLDRILTAEWDFFGVQCDTVAFTASARSITFAMQASLSGIPEFDAWYSRKQSWLRNEPLARFFQDFRRISQHVGDNAVVGGSYDENGHRFFFGALPDLPSVPELDVATACSKYFKIILELVFECYMTFPTLINGQWRYTKEHYASLGKTIEDAESDLGFSRGWSKISGLDEDTCWQLLRRQADGCNIQSQFQEWLGKRVPCPDDEP
jgi:hypothetical protein